MSDALVPVQNVDAEESVLGAMLVSESTVTAALSDVGLEASDFYLEKHAAIFACIADLAQAGKPIDELVVTDSLHRRGETEQAGGQHYVSELAAKVPAAGNARHYAEIVQTCSSWRRRVEAGQTIQQAAQTFDDAAFETAIASLADRPSQSSDFFDIERQRELLYSLMEGRSRAEFYWPIDKLNRLQGGGERGSAGMRRGQLIVVSGYTNEGKSHFAGQVLDQNHRRHGKVCLYDNEMEPEEQIARHANRTSGVPYGPLMDGSLDPDQAAAANKFLNSDLHWPMVQIKGWSVPQVCLHIRQYGWDLVVIDILHNFQFKDERELSNAVAQLKATASLAKCCIVLVAHVNRSGVDQNGYRRRPIRSDLRWSGDIENLADVVCFVYREQDPDTGEPTNNGWIYFDKCRGGKLGAASAVFEGDRGRWTAALQRSDGTPPPGTELFAA